MINWRSVKEFLFPRKVEESPKFYDYCYLGVDLGRVTRLALVGWYGSDPFGIIDYKEFRPHDENSGGYERVLRYIQELDRHYSIKWIVLDDGPWPGVRQMAEPMFPYRVVSVRQVNNKVLDWPNYHFNFSKRELKLNIDRHRLRFMGMNVDESALLPALLAKAMEKVEFDREQRVKSTRKVGPRWLRNKDVTKTNANPTKLPTVAKRIKNAILSVLRNNS